MCRCGHGSDRHYIGYAGVGVCGGVLAECLQKGCNCKAYTALPVSWTIPATYLNPSSANSGGHLS